MLSTGLQECPAAVEQLDLPSSSDAAVPSTEDPVDSSDGTEPDASGTGVAILRLSCDQVRTARVLPLSAK